MWLVYDDFRGWLTSYVNCHRVCVCILSVFSPDLCGFLVHNEIFNNRRCLVGSRLGDSSHLECFLATLGNLGVNLLKQLLLRSPFKIEWPSFPWNRFVIFTVCSGGILSLNHLFNWMSSVVGVVLAIYKMGFRIFVLCCFCGLCCCFLVLCYCFFVVCYCVCILDTIVGVFVLSCVYLVYM